MTRCKVRDCTNASGWIVDMLDENFRVEAQTNLCKYHMNENATKDLVLDNGEILEAKNKGWKLV